MGLNIVQHINISYTIHNQFNQNSEIWVLLIIAIYQLLIQSHFWSKTNRWSIWLKCCRRFLFVLALVKYLLEMIKYTWLNMQLDASVRDQIKLQWPHLHPFHKANTMKLYTYGTWLGISMTQPGIVLYVHYSCC